jgi:alkanesulfonate monooxygenase SsuD/methylene tetrahydromethanopterin reductase-like flavin-dependent oxidoreductase (luciferase family)
MASTDAERILAFARRAEELGFDGLFAFDHFFPPGAPPDRPSFEAYATLAAVAAVTERVRLGTLVTRASLRPAGLLAKQAVALDDLSGGRFVLGIGTGDAISRPEHIAFGMPYLGPEVRREHLAETVGALRALWRGEPWAGGEHVPEVAGPLLPPARTTDGPPLWIGGTSSATVRLAGTVADGWNGWGMDVERFAARVATLREAAAGRDVEPTWGGACVVGTDDAEARLLAERRRERGIRGDAFVGDVEAFVGRIADLAAAGATWVVVLAGGASDRMELIADRVLPHLGART